MAKIIEMPKLSDTMTEGAIARWLVKEGDKIQSGMPIVEIETDKATMEYESPSSGTLLKILVGDRGQCALNAPIAVVGKPGEDWQPALEAKSGGAAKPAAEAPRAVPQQPQRDESEPTKAPQPAPQPGGRVKASPLARKVAAERRVDLALVQGTGPNGRVVLRDLEGATSRPAAVAAAPAAAATPEYETIPLTMMRKTIARRLVQSVTEAPHFFLTMSLDVGALLDWRKATMERLKTKFSLNDILVHLVARALKAHPEINASWNGDSILRYRTVHMGVAVALPTGLVTPVVRNADQLNLVEIAQRTQELAQLARDGKLQNEDFNGATFCISNLGMYGIEEFTAIINPPQSAILAVGAAVPTPVVDDEGIIVVKRMMKVTMSCDHRVIDGAMGAEFLRTLKRFIEDPLAALLLG